MATFSPAPVAVSALGGGCVGLIGIVEADIQRIGHRFQDAVGGKGRPADILHIHRLFGKNLVQQRGLRFLKELGVILSGVWRSNSVFFSTSSTVSSRFISCCTADTPNRKLSQ